MEPSGPWPRPLPLASSSGSSAVLRMCGGGCLPRCGASQSLAPAAPPPLPLAAVQLRAVEGREQRHPPAPQAAAPLHVWLSGEDTLSGCSLQAEGLPTTAGTSCPHSR